MHMHLQRPLKSQSLHNMLAEKLSSPWVHPRFKGEQENTRAKTTKTELSSSPKIPHVVSKMLQGPSSDYFCQLCQNFSPPATPSPPPLHRREPKACSTERRGGERSGLDAQLKHVMRMESNTLWPDRYTRTDVSDTWHARGSSQGFPLKHAHTRLFTVARYTRPHTRLRHALCYEKQGASSVCVQDTGAFGGVGDTEEEEKAWWGNYFSDYFSLTATLKICFFLNYWSPAAINETNRRYDPGIPHSLTSLKHHMEKMISSRGGRGSAYDSSSTRWKTVVSLKRWTSPHGCI